MSLIDNIERIMRSQQEMLDRMSTTYICVVCGKDGLNYTTVLQNAFFQPNDASCYIDTSLSKCMVVCGEKCRKTFVNEGGVPYDMLMDGVGVPKRYWGKLSDLVYGNKKQQIYDDWINNPIKSIYLAGTTGTGKTTLAFTLAYELRKLEYRVKFYRSSDLAIRCNNIHNDGGLGRLLTELDVYDALIIDDITQHSLTITGKECMFTIYNRLYEENKLVVFTSNCRMSEVAKNIDERLGSRIIEMCTEMVLAGKDKRLKLNGEDQNVGEQ